MNSILIILFNAYLLDLAFQFNAYLLQNEHIQSAYLLKEVYRSLKIGLSGNLNLDKFKLYMADTGLMVSLIFKDKDFTENTIYTKLLSNKLSKNLGMLYENIVAQTLVSKSYKLFYYSFYDSVQKRTFEVDFLLSKGNKVSPIEVKSSNYRQHRSLDEFSKKYSDRINSQYLIHTKDLKKEGNIRYLPFYMAQFL